jgi:hypothetical protein
LRELSNITFSNLTHQVALMVSSTRHSSRLRFNFAQRDTCKKENQIFFIANDRKRFGYSPLSISFSRPAWLFVCGVMMFAGLAIPFERFPFGIGGGGAI